MAQDPLKAALAVLDEPDEQADPLAAALAVLDEPEPPQQYQMPLLESRDLRGMADVPATPEGPVAIEEMTRSVGRGAAQAGIGVAQGGLLAQEAFDRVTEVMWEKLLGYDVGGVHGAREQATKLQAVKEGVLPARGERGFWTHDLMEGFGQALAYMGGGALGGPAGLGATAVAAGFAEGFYDAEAHNATEEEKWASALANGGLALTELVGPLPKILARFNLGTGGSLRQAMVRMLTEGGQEAIQEVVQGAGSNIVAKGLYDEEREALAGLKTAGPVGFLVGALLSGASSGVARTRAQMKATEGAARAEPMGGDDPAAAAPSVSTEPVQAQEEVVVGPSGVAGPIEFSDPGIAGVVEEGGPPSAAVEGPVATDVPSGPSETDQLDQLNQLNQTGLDAEPARPEPMSADDYRLVPLEDDAAPTAEGEPPATPEEAGQVQQFKSLAASGMIEAKPTVAAQIDVPEEGRADKIVREVHDYMQSWVRAEEAAGDVPDKASPVLTETLRRGRSKVRMEELQDKHLRPILSDLREGKVSLEELEEYLYARHAPERNKTIQEINPDNDAGSGMSDAEAAKIITKVESDPRFASFRSAAHKFDRMNLAVLDNAVADGLMSSEDAANLRERWQHYAPLRHLEGDEGAFTGTGQGVQTRGREFKRALGRESKAQHILSFAVTQAQREILRGEKAKVGQAVGRFLRMFDPGHGIATISPKQVMRGVRADGTVGMVTDPRFKDADNVYTYKEGGVEKVIEFAPEYQDFATGLKNLDAKESNRVVRAMRTYVRYLGGMITRHNPFFAPFNAIRDAGHALLTGTAEGGIGLGAKTLVRIPLAWRAMAAEARNPGVETTDKMRLAYREYVKQGAPISFLDLGDVSETERSIQRDLAAARGGSKEAFLRAAANVVDVIDRTNDLFENGARVSVFYERLQQGWTPARAAQYAKNFTVNFEKRGSKTQNLNAFYMFAQAGINGTARIVLPLAKGHRGMLKVVGGVVAAGSLSELANYMMGGDDEETGENNYLKIPQWERDFNMIFMDPSGSGEYVKIPMPYAWSFFWNLGRNSTAAALGSQSAGQSAVRIAKSGIDNFSPIGGDESTLTMLSPTVLDPWVSVLANEKWTGARVYTPKEYRGDRAASDMGWERTPAIYKNVAKAMEAATADGPADVGWADIPPEAIQHIVEQQVGGVGQEVERILNIGSRLAAGEDVQAREIPLVRRLYGTPSDYQIVERYREIRQEIRQARTALKDATEAGDTERAERIKSDAAKVLGLDGLLKTVERLDRKVGPDATPEQAEALRKAQQALIRAYTTGKE